MKVAGNSLVPDIQAVLGDMTAEEREEFVIMQEAMAKRRARLRGESNNMDKGPAAHTFLSYVRCHDGVIRKMMPDTAQQYVDQHKEAYPNVEIVKEGEMPVPDTNEVIGATKATTGEVFGDDGRQIADVQPMTTRVFAASDRTMSHVVNPGIGTPAEGVSVEDAPKPTEPHRTNTPRVRRPDSAGDEKPAE